MGQSGTYACPYCEGKGCSECSETGKRVTTWIDLDDGEAKMRVHGNAALTEDDRAALAALGRAACEQLGDPR